MTYVASRGIEAVGLGSAQVNLCEPESVETLKRLIRREDALVIISAVTPDKGRDVQTFMNNVTMGMHVSLFLQHAPCAHVVYVSSDAVYADGLSLIRETSYASPSTFHGLMHLVRERMLLQALAGSQVPLTILRPCALYGPTDTHIGYGPNRFLRSAMRQRLITLFGEGEERRDHVYVGDLSRLIGLCVAHRTSGLLNVATGTAVSFARVAKMVAALIEEPVRLESLPRQSAVTHRHFDTSELVRVFPGFRITPIVEGLRLTLHQMTEDTVTHTLR